MLENLFFNRKTLQIRFLGVKSRWPEEIGVWLEDNARNDSFKIHRNQNKNMNTDKREWWFYWLAGPCDSGRHGPTVYGA